MIPKNMIGKFSASITLKYFDFNWKLIPQISEIEEKCGKNLILISKDRAT